MTAAVVPAGERRPVVRRAWGTVIGAAVVVSLVRPGAWAVGLAGFLARGGVVLLALPIVVLPTPTGLQNALGGPVSSVVFGALSPALVALFVVIAMAAVVVVGVGSWVAAWAERQGIALALEAAADEGLVVPSADLRGAPGVARVALLRLLGLAPPVLALLLGWRRIYDVTYHELILPGDLATALPVRVIRDIPWVIIGVLVAWVVGDAAASTGIRRLVLERRPVLVAWLLGWFDLVRRPLRVLGTGLAGVGVAIALVAPALLAAAVGWSRVQAAMLDGREPVAALVVVATWVTTWLGSLVLAGVGAAIRNAAWTLELPTPT